MEARRLLRQPLVVVGLELSLYLHLRTVASGEMPVVPRDEVVIAYTMLPLATATMLAMNWATLRSRRHGLEESDQSLPMAPAPRTAAHLLSVSATVVLAAVAVIADLVVLRLRGGVGMPNPFELATGPAVVAFAGVLGVLLARLAPWVGTASVITVCFAASWYLPYLVFRITGQVWVWRSFSLFPWFGTPGFPADWTSAFAGSWHLGYVVGLTALMACLALALSSEGRRMRFGTTTILAGGLAVALATTSAAAQTRSGAVAAAELEDVRVATGSPGTQVCATRSGVRYCAWPPYRSWIGQWWERPVAGVLRRVPPEHRRLLRVRQMELGDAARCWDAAACPERAIRQEMERAFAGSDVRPSSSWPRDSREQGRTQLVLAAFAGAWAVGLPTAPLPEEDTLTMCMPREARVVVALWLAGQSTRRAEITLRARTLGPVRPQGSSPRPRSWLTLGSDLIIPQWPWEESAYAVALLDRPPDDVAARLHQDWVRWTAAGTPTADLVRDFGLLPLSGSPAGEATAGSGVEGRAGCSVREEDHAQN